MSSILRIVVYLVIATVLAGALAAGAIFVQGVPIRAAQASAKALLGEDVTLCHNTAPAKRKSAPLFNGKIVLLDSRTDGIETTLYEALPPNLRASQASEIGLIVCVKPVKSLYDTDYYGANRKYSCTRYTQDLQIMAVDPATKTVSASDIIEGATPPECPDRTDTDLTKYGDLPTASDIVKWLNFTDGSEKPA